MLLADSCTCAAIALRADERYRPLLGNSCNDLVIDFDCMPRFTGFETALQLELSF